MDNLILNTGIYNNKASSKLEEKSDKIYTLDQCNQNLVKQAHILKSKDIVKEPFA